MIDKNLEKYILAHTESEDEVLADLYRKTHIRFVNPNMVSGHLQGKILTMISNMVSLEKIRPGGFIIADNALLGGKVLFTFQVSLSCIKLTSDLFNTDCVQLF